jgi:hypothetical protein
MTASQVRSDDGQIRDYNRVFERLNATNDITGSVAYITYKSAKREWLKEFQDRTGRHPTEDELKSYAATQTDAVLNSHRASAEKILEIYAGTIKEDIRPQILGEALKGSFSRSFWPSFWASFAFTAVLLAVVVIAALLGFGFPVQIALPIKMGA